MPEMRRKYDQVVVAPEIGQGLAGKGDDNTRPM